ncbi:MAG: RelA/SpoT domain-containing protein [Candidatus Korobacteraceae bacterium]
MLWVPPMYSRFQVNQAARILVDPPLEVTDQSDESFAIIGNWRTAHNFPLNTFQIGLRRRAKQVDENAIVVQRLKRLSSIALKLQRFPEMKLSQMQDVAGCRAVVESVSQVVKLVNLYKKSDIKHKLVHEDDYIQHPKESGYRGVHLVYRYFSDRSELYNDLKVEVQIRSYMQHYWATAVETVGTFIQQALKSSQGEEDWLRFFVLMGAAIAAREGTPPVPNAPVNRREWRAELRHYVNALDVENHLRVYASALTAPERVGQDAHYFLLELDPVAREVKVTGYKRDELEKASNDYLSAERSAISGRTFHDAVLVSAESLKSLKLAYPNYFLDTHRFIQVMKHAVGKPKPYDGQTEFPFMRGQ